MSIDVVVGGLPGELSGANIPQFVASHLASRIAAGDASVWGENAEREASIRLGWVNAPVASRALVTEIAEVREQFLAQGIERFVLAAVGGAAIAADMLARTANTPLLILDSLDPAAVTRTLTDLGKTAIIIASKSGETVEAQLLLGAAISAFDAADIDASEHIVVVTDPGTPLAQTAEREGYKLFKSDVLVDDQFGALTATSLVPVGLAGFDVDALLQEACDVAPKLGEDSGDNPAILLGAAIAAGAPARDKLGLVQDGSRLKGFSKWVEQLVARSTGKAGTGLLPIVLETDAPELSTTPDDLQIVRFTEFRGLPSANDIKQAGSLGGSILLWEYAVAIAAVALGVNPFASTLDVRLNTLLQVVDAGDATSHTLLNADGITVSSPNAEATATTLDEAIGWLFGQLEDASYIAIDAFIDQTAYPQAQELRAITAGVLGRPVTFGWGPDSLYATEQYHVDGPGTGVFLQLTSDPVEDLVAPGETLSFGTLIRAQSELAATKLAERQLPVLTIHIDNPDEQIKTVANAIAGFAMVK